MYELGKVFEITHKLTIMDSLKNGRSVTRHTGDKLSQQLSHDNMDITGTNNASFEMSSKSAHWVSPLAAKPNSTFPSPLTALGCLPTARSSRLSNPCNTVSASDQSLAESDSEVDDVTFRLNEFDSAGSGYLLSCDTRSTDQVNSVSDWPKDIIATSNMTYDEFDVRRNSWNDPLAASRQLDEDSGRSRDLISNYHAQPGCAQLGSNMTSFDGIDVVSSSTGSSTISLPSSTSTSISVATDALPIFMSPVESVKSCPQYRRCHGYNPVSLQNNHGNTMLYTTPDLLHTTEPDQFSSTSTSSTMCMNSPLVCSGHFQPPVKSLKSVRPGSVDDEGANSVSLVSSAPIASKMKSAPNEEDPANPVEMVASAWLTSLVNEGHVGESIEHEATTPTTASMIMNSASEMDSTLFIASFHTSFPPTTPQNCDKYDDESFSRVVANSASIAVATNNISTPDDHQSSLYPRIYPACPSSAYPAYPPPEYPGHSSFGYHPYPTPGYHAHPPSGYYPGPDSILFSRPTSHSLPYGDHGDATVKIPPINRRRFSSREDDRPRSAADDKHEQKVPLHKRGPNAVRRRLVDQFPDLLPAIAWCLNYVKTSTSSSHSSTTPMSIPFIHKIIVECIPGIKERGGIGITTIRKLASRVKKTMRYKVDFDRTKAITTPTTTVASSLTQHLLQEISAEIAMDSVSHSVSKGNTDELPDRLADSIPSSIMKDDDFEFLKAPAEPILQSIMKLVNNISNAGSTASSRKNRTEKSQHRSLDNDAQHKFDATTSYVCNDDITTSGSIFQSLMDAHDIAEDEVKRLSNTSKTFCASSSADDSDANEPPVKSSHFQPEIAAANDKGNDVANDPAMCNDYDSDDDVMVIDEGSQNI